MGLTVSPKTVKILAGKRTHCKQEIKKETINLQIYDESMFKNHNLIWFCFVDVVEGYLHEYRKPYRKNIASDNESERAKMFYNVAGS